MLRFLLTVALSAALAAAFVIFNPSDKASELLTDLDLLDTLKESYTIEPPPPPPPLPANPFATRFAPEEAENRSGQNDALDRSIRYLLEENQALVEKKKRSEAARLGSSIQSGEARAIQRQIDANKVRILDLQNQRKKL